MVTQKNKNLPCGCPCGCQKPTLFPYTSSRVLARRARCNACQKPMHQEKYQKSPRQTQPEETLRPITAFKPVDPEDMALDRHIAEQQRQNIYQQAWEKWQESLPEKFKHATTDHPKIQERLRRWGNGLRGTSGAVIMGGVGEGKTFMAVGYANTAIKEGLLKPNEVLFGTEAELLSSAANSAFSEVDKALRRLISPRHKMLIIDDVGRGTWIRDDMRPKVFSLVLDAAWRDNRVVVITTNLIPADLQDYIGEGALDRLRSMVGYDAIDLNDRGMRKKITQETLQKGTKK